MIQMLVVMLDKTALVSERRKARKFRLESSRKSLILREMMELIAY